MHPVLRKLQHETDGVNIFRRYRMTHLEKSDCPETLKHFWSGHAPRHVSERYVKLSTDREYRLQWAERIGLGFECQEAREMGNLGNSCSFRKRAKLLKRLVDETGIEPATSSLRTRRSPS